MGHAEHGPTMRRRRSSRPAMMSCTSARSFETRFSAAFERGWASTMLSIEGSFLTMVKLRSIDEQYAQNASKSRNISGRGHADMLREMPYREQIRYPSRARA